MPSQERKEKSTRSDKLDRYVGKPLLLLVGIAIVLGGAYIVQNDFWKPEEFMRKRLERMGYSLEPTAMFEAIERHDIKGLGRLQRVGIPLSARNDEGHTPIIAAIHEDLSEAITELLALGAAPLEPDTEGNTPLAHAVKLQHYDFVERFLGLGASVNETLVDGVPPLIWAIENDDQKMVALFLEQKADFAVESIGGPPIFVAVAAGNEQIVRQLLDVGADPNTLDPGGRPLAVAALDLERPDLARLLLEASAAPNLKGRGDRSLVHRAFEDRDEELFDLAVRAGGDIKIPGPSGLTMFQEAAAAKDLKWLTMLLDRGADANQRSADDNPLWWEFYNEGQIDVAEQLLDAGADIDALDAGGARPVDRALAVENLRMSRYLFNRGAEAETAGGKFWYALMDKNYALMRLLLSRGVSPNLPNADDLKPLTYAVRYGDEHAALLLLESGAKLDTATKVTGHTLFEWTLAWKQPMLAEVLIQRGADPNQRISSPVRSEFLDHFEGRGNLQFYLKNDTGLTPMMVVAGSGQYEMLTMLKKKGATKSLNTTKWKSWPINFAVKAEDIRMAQMLLGRDPDTDGKDRKIVVNLDTQKAIFYEQGEVIYTASCSTGKKGYRTEPGIFVITNKDRLRRSNLYDANMPYFMRLSCSAIGLHQGNIPGYPASHGCIRLPYSYAKKFFATAQVGDIVEIK